MPMSSAEDQIKAASSCSHVSRRFDLIFHRAKPVSEMERSAIELHCGLGFPVRSLQGRGQPRRLSSPQPSVSSLPFQPSASSLPPIPCSHPIHIRGGLMNEKVFLHPVVHPHAGHSITDRLQLIVRPIRDIPVHT